MYCTTLALTSNTVYLGDSVKQQNIFFSMVSVFVFVIICVQFEDESSSEQQAVGAASASARQQQDEHGVYNAPEVG